MIASLSFLLGVATLSFASPVQVRAVTNLNQAAFDEAHHRDAGATRAFSSTEIKTSDGRCLFVDELSGDFRANLTPIQLAACDGSAGQLWDIITAGIHNDRSGKMLVVNTLTQACLDFNQGRKGREVTAFSCGGRAAGEGVVSVDQLFPFPNTTSFGLNTDRGLANNVCLAVVGAALGPAPCSAGDAKQAFTIGGDAALVSPGPVSSAVVSSASVSAAPLSSAPVSSVIASPKSLSAEAPAPTSPSSCISTTLVTVTRGDSSTQTSAEAATSPAETSPAETTPAESTPAETSVAEVITSSVKAPAQIANPTTPVPVSRAGGVLNPTLAAEANARDDTATRAFASVSLKSSSGKCLFIDPTAGDFRQNLIPVQVRDCTGDAGEKFDMITSGKHNNKPGNTLVVSSLMQGCLNFDSRRAAGDTAMVFSCGGRAAGEGGTTPDQLFAFTGGNTIDLTQSKNEGNQVVKTCLAPAGGKLDSSTNCAGDNHVFSIV